MAEQNENRDLSLRHSGIEHQAIPAGIFTDPVLKATDRNVLCVMRSQLKQGSKLVMPTYKEIRRYANIRSDATVSRAIAILRITRWIVKTQELRDSAGRIIRVVYDLCDEPESLQRVIDEDTGFLEFIKVSQHHYHPAVASAARAANQGIDLFNKDVSDGKCAVRKLGIHEKQEIREVSAEHLEKIRRDEAAADTHYHYLTIDPRVTVMDEMDDNDREARLQKMKCIVVVVVVVYLQLRLQRKVEYRKQGHRNSSGHPSSSSS